MRYGVYWPVRILSCLKDRDVRARVPSPFISRQSTRSVAAHTYHHKGTALSIRNKFCTRYLSTFRQRAVAVRACRQLTVLVNVIAAIAALTTVLEWCYQS